MNKSFWIQLLLLGLLAGFTWCARQHATTPASPAPSGPVSSSRGAQPAGQRNKSVPEYALDVLYYVKTNQKAPDGYEGGRTFENREKRLPAKDEQGTRIIYREWDVHPKVRGQNRGAERLITGSNTSAYYTADHYKTFVKVE